MPTTKQRKKTPMRNKPCLWRRIAKKEYDGTTEIRNGRKIRNMMVQLTSNIKGGMLPIHEMLFAKAGMLVQKIDNAIELQHNDNTVKGEVIEAI